MKTLAVKGPDCESSIAREAGVYCDELRCRGLVDNARSILQEARCATQAAEDEGLLGLRGKEVSCDCSAEPGVRAD